MIAPISKKGQVQSIAPAILALFFAGIVLIFGLVITQSLADIDSIRQSKTGSAINETLTTVSEKGEVVTNAARPGFSSFSVSIVTNATTGVVIPSTNYTTDSTGRVSFVTPGGNVPFFNNTNWNVTYTYTYGGEAYESANSTVAGLGTFGDFWEIIVLAIVISVVIGLLLVVFGTGGRRR